MSKKCPSRLDYTDKSKTNLQEYRNMVHSDKLTSPKRIQEVIPTDLTHVIDRLEKIEANMIRMRTEINDGIARIIGRMDFYQRGSIGTNDSRLGPSAPPPSYSPGSSTDKFIHYKVDRDM